MSDYIIDKDKAWLKERIERGIEGFIDCEREYLTELLMKYIYEDIFLSGCSINNREGPGQEAVLQIRIPLPDADTCGDFVDGMRPANIFTEH